MCFVCCYFVCLTVCAVQRRAAYTVRKKSNRWQLSLLFWCIDMAAVNGFILFNLKKGIKDFEDQLRYRCALVNCLLMFAGGVAGVPRPLAAEAPPAPRQLKSEPLPESRLVGADHLPVWSDKKSKCHLCYHRGLPPKTTMQKCSACLVYLCNVPERMCFRDYHCAASGVGV